MSSVPSIVLAEREPGYADLRRALLVAELRVSRLEQRLQDSEEALRAVTETLPVGVVRIDCALRVRYANEAQARHLLGTEPANLNGRLVAEVIGEAAFAIVEPRLAQVLSGWAVDFEALLPLPTGTFEVRVSLAPERKKNGAVRGMIAVVQDISGRREAQDRLHQRHREFKTLAENAPDIVARTDRQLRYVFLNRAAETTFGVRLWPDSCCDAISLGFPADYADPTNRVIACAIRDGREHSICFTVGSGQQRRDFVARAVPEFESVGRVASVLLTVYDDNERVLVQALHERQLEDEHAARRLAETAARSRDEFLAVVSHELRSPLNGIQSWAVVLESAIVGASPVAARALAGISIGVAQQVRLIDDLLDATRIIAGELSLSLAPVRLAAVVRAAVESVRPKAAECGVELLIELKLGEAAVDGDSDRLQQIVWNLLSNAIKFTPRGGHVWLECQCEDEQAVIAVRDDGRGIAPIFLPMLFDRFQREEIGNSRGQDGFGLGLMLVRHLCRLHGGDVVGASAGRNCGARFTVRLPLRGVAETALYQQRACRTEA